MTAAIPINGSCERVRADRLVPGDVFASTRPELVGGGAVRLVRIGNIGSRSRWLYLERHGRIRPRHETLFWRKARP